MTTALLAILETVFVTLGIFFFTTERKPSDPSNKALAYSFLLTGICLIGLAIVLRRRNKRLAQVAWVILFLTFVLALVFPRL
jgi:hypothetical protein